MPPPQTGTVAATDQEALRRALIVQLLNKRGYFPTPQVETPPAPAPKPPPTGFGRVLQQAGRGLGVALSGENAANAIGNAVGAGNVGTTVMDQIERVPVVGRPLAFAADVATSPMTIATAGFGGVLGAVLRGGQTAGKAAGFGRFLAPLVEPLVAGSLPARVGAEVAMASGSAVAGNVAEAAGLPAPLVAAASIGGGLVGLRTAANVAKNATRTAGGMTPEQVKEAIESGDPVRKFSAVLSSASLQRGELKAAQEAERAVRTASIQTRLKGVTDPGQRSRIIAQGSAGELPKQALEFPEGTFGREGVTPRSAAERMDEAVSSLPKGEILPVGRRSAPDAVAGKVWYHGTGAKDLTPDALNPQLTKENNLFGHGIYLTDDASVAAGYSKARSKRSGEPSVYQMRVQPQAVLDLELPMTPEVREIIEGSLTPLIKDGYADDVMALLSKEGTTTEQAWLEMTKALDDWSHGERIPSYEVSDMLAEMSDSFRGLGFDALTHTGGLRTGKPAHQVLVMLDPNNVSGFVDRKVPFSEFSAIKPTAAEEAVGPVAGTITPSDIASIRQQTSNYYANLGRVYDERNASTALNKLFTGEIPTPSEIGLLQNALGAEFAGTVKKLADPQKLLSWKSALDLAGVPRAVMSSFDLSPFLRQGATLLSRPTYWRELKPMVLALKDETYAKVVMEQLATDTHPVTAALRKAGHITGLPSNRLSGREENYMSNYAEVFPGVAQSQRAAVTLLNKSRADGGKDIYSKIERLTKAPPTEADVDSIVKWMSISTGRGPLPENAAEVASLLNNLFFSPRFLSSIIARLNPRTYMSLTPAVRREAFRDMASFFGLGMTGITGLALAGKSGLIPDVHVEHDYRSSDFGRVRLGQTRIDPWAGFQPLARFGAQLITGQSKNAAGDIMPRDRASTLMNFARGKLGPPPSFIVDALTGTTFLGEEVDVVGGQGLDRAAASRLAPLFLQDLADAIVADGSLGVLKAAPAAFGMGATTYNGIREVRQAGAQEKYGKPYDALTGDEKDAVNLAYAEQIAKLRSPGAATVQGFSAQEDIELRKLEQQYAAALHAGGIKNADFTRGMNEAIQKRHQRVQAIWDFEGGENQSTVVDQYFDLRNQAMNGVGAVDYQLLDQLQANFLASLTEDERWAITERTSFAHAPQVQWWVDAKKQIQESGYYRTQAESMKVLAPLLKALGMEGKTYNQLVASAGTATSAQEIALVAGMVKRVDQLTKQLQALQRAKNPELDSALGLVYGSPSVFARNR